jgi:hypothetical protein
VIPSSSARNQDSNVYLRHRISRVQTLGARAGGNSFHPHLIYMPATALIYNFDHPREGRWIGVYRASNILVTSSSDLSTRSVIFFFVAKLHEKFDRYSRTLLPNTRAYPSGSLTLFALRMIKWRKRFLTFYHSIYWKRQETLPLLELWNRSG